MGKSGKRKGYRPRPEEVRIREAQAARLAADREEKKQWLIRAVCIAVAVLLFLFAAWGIFDVIARRTGFYLRSQVAFSTPHCTVNGAMLSYYYHEYCMAELAENEEYYTSLGVDPQKPLDGQVYDEKTGKSWKDHFADTVRESLLRMIVFAEAAHSEGISQTLRQTAEKAAEDTLSALQREATAAGLTLDAHIAALYGFGVGAEDIRAAEELAAVAADRQTAWAAQTFTPAERLALYEEKPERFFVADMIAYKVQVDLDGIAYEDYRAEYLRAENRAQALAAMSDEAAFVAAMRADMQREDPSLSAYALEKAVEATYLTEIPHGAKRGYAEEWLFADGRAVGDTAVLGETGNYTVVFCRSVAAAPAYHSVTARRLFFAYSKGNEAALLEEAKSLRETFLADGGDGEAFAALAIEHGEDEIALGGGLWQSVTRADAERAVADWLFHASRKKGDSAVIPAAFGVYFVYYAERSPYPLWEKWAIEQLLEADFARLLEASAVTVRAGVFDALPSVTYPL